MDHRSSPKACKWQVAHLFLLCSWGWVSGQLRYSIVEESEPRTIVANVAQDLGVKRSEIFHRRLHFETEKETYFSLNSENGALIVKDRIDRESLCGSSPHCLLQLEVVAENPVEIFSLEIEILDINDNSPTFSSNYRNIKISEVFTSPGAQFALESAEDLDVGVNGVSQYILNANPYFSLSVKNRKDGTLIPQLILEKNADREEKTQHNLILTAIDGGEPARSGTCHIIVIVLDINDNPPVFSQSVYKFSLKENPPLHSVILILNATDLDEGENGEIRYYFDDHTSKSARKLFDLNEQNGEILVKGILDFEDIHFYELYIKSVDKGTPPLEGNCLIHIDIDDVNDNAPEISLTSMTNIIPENAAFGTVVAFINVRDKDSGKNGEVKLDLSPNVPFKIRYNQNRYALVTDGNLDREETSQYTIELTASDLGSPPLYSKTSVTLSVSDINDNAPVFTQSTYNAFITENSDPGTLLCTVSATDLDEVVNSDLVYSTVESQIDGSSVSSFVYIHSSDGNIYAQRSFDYEHIQVLQITIKVEDSGSPQLSSTVPVFIFILDTNDNPPTLLYPEHSEDLIVQERIPKSTSAGYLVTKLSAVDLDSGHNAWLFFTLIDAINYSSFQVSKHTGEVRTVRGLQETENMEQQLVISISDQGNPPLSTTVTVLLSIADEVVVERPKSGDFLTNSKPPSDMTLYLIISLVAISLVSLVTFMILLVKCLRKDSYDYSSSCCFLGGSQSKPYTDQYQPALYLNTDGTLKYMEVRMVPPGSQGQSYQTNLPPALEQQDLHFWKPLDFPQLNVAKPADNSSELSCENEPGQVRTMIC
ncbi:protocadherin gamma-C5-like [Rhinoderma darwinii]|uniref:protocadherin gamma-C5-like n=1 Tax=Rhinoderma darwinii TaxID=43563 RepID=UPI003F660F9C